MGEKTKTKEKKKGNAAFMKEMKISENLAAVVGDRPKPRSRIVQKLWAYIKENELQDKKNKRMINPDKVLGKVLGDKPIDMFKMIKKVSEHLS